MYESVWWREQTLRWQQRSLSSRHCKRWRVVSGVVVDFGQGKVG